MRSTAGNYLLQVASYMTYIRAALAEVCTIRVHLLYPWDPRDAFPDRTLHFSSVQTVQSSLFFRFSAVSVQSVCFSDHDMVTRHLGVPLLWWCTVTDHCTALTRQPSSTTFFDWSCFQFVTFRTFDAIQNSADAHKELRHFYPRSTILMPTCNI